MLDAFVMRPGEARKPIAGMPQREGNHSISLGREGGPGEPCLVNPLKNKAGCLLPCQSRFWRSLRQHQQLLLAAALSCCIRNEIELLSLAQIPTPCLKLLSLLLCMLLCKGEGNLYPASSTTPQWKSQPDPQAEFCSPVLGQECWQRSLEVRGLLCALGELVCRAGRWVNKKVWHKDE